MKKFYSVLLTIALSLGVLTACQEAAPKDNETTNNNQQEVSESVFPVTVKDALGEEVVIEKEPEKVVSLIPSNTEISFALGLGSKMVGVSDYDNYPSETADIEKVGGMEFNVEKIISLDPDLVLAHASSAHNSTEGLKQLRNSGIKVVVVNDAANFSEVYSSIEMIGQVSGKSEEAKELIASMQAKVADIQEKTSVIPVEDQKSVYIEVSGEPNIFTTGKNTFMQEMLDMIHAQNVITEDGWIQVDQEAIIKANPDVIITTYGAYSENDLSEVILARKGWESITAVKDKQIIDVDSDAVSRSGPRLVEGVEDIAKAVYPDVFK